MISFAEYALKWRLAARRIQQIAPEVIREVAVLAEERAKWRIGHELAEWPPLASSTITEKQRLGFVGHVSRTDPLLRTGEMRDSIEAYVTNNGLMHSAVLIATDRKMAFHEFGTGHHPPRPVLEPTVMQMEGPAIAMLEGRLLAAIA